MEHCFCIVCDQEIKVGSFWLFVELGDKNDEEIKVGSFWYSSLVVVVLVV